MRWLDEFVERISRNVARRSSRRSLLKSVGGFMAGATAIPLLPVARAAEGPEGAVAVADFSDDPYSCDYWRYCAISGFLCGCCGGSYNSCPPGTEMSPITWIGTCLNPVDNRKYIVSYNDCCGKPACGNCGCGKGENDLPIYRADKSNQANWCLGTASSVYHCSTAIVLGTALE